MTREQMEHILRAAAAITGERVFVVVGSQALLAYDPDLKPPLNLSMELDVYPMENPTAADLIDGSIGEVSPFHEAFGYYAHGVGPETARLPSGWQARVIVVENENTGGARGHCISPADLAVSKLIAGREKDLVFVQHMLEHKVIDAEIVRQLLPELKEPAAAMVEQRLARLRP